MIIWMIYLRRQAVMEYNLEKKTNYKFILVQIPENVKESSLAYADGLVNL